MMNKIKVIKRANLQSPLGEVESKAMEIDSSSVRRTSAQAVKNWVDEWREQKPTDARRTFAELFGSSKVSAT